MVERNALTSRVVELEAQVTSMCERQQEALMDARAEIAALQAELGYSAPRSAIGVRGQPGNGSPAGRRAAAAVGVGRMPPCEAAVPPGATALVSRAVSPGPQAPYALRQVANFASVPAPCWSAQGFVARQQSLATAPVVRNPRPPPQATTSLRL
eukprot:gnl/TRDRNA2_/TRDRNA2_134383_c1_seq1.p2 gnl/TRDRNA2_/TRDRNA2_134383_c1~~gnl/TRDRNA2_/TRDRNA2_134383_c1_seq1.p2  ORF type:complete len:154 (+),score=21.01 gnl/TRDRNA2_/TRDRNA2_134383_c1_seq1:352-813(+)